MESAHREELVSQAAELQFGHGTITVESRSAAGKMDAAIQLQFGHGTITVESTVRKIGSDSRSRRFNSATALSPWKASSARSEKHLAWELQFGHGTITVESRKQTTSKGDVVGEELQFGHGTALLR